MYKTLVALTQLLNDALRLAFGLTEDVAFLCPVKEAGNSSASNKVCVSSVNT